MAKHGGCYVCGSRKDEVLISIPECHALPSIDLGKKIQRIREAIEKAREAAANG